MDETHSQNVADGLRSIPYEETQAAKPPITLPTSTSSNPVGDKSAHSLTPMSSKSKALNPEKDLRRDSGLAPSRDSKIEVDSEDQVSAPRIPQIKINNDSASVQKTGTKRWKRARHSDAKIDGVPKIQSPFQGITLDIPTGELDDFTAVGLDFTKRGSMLIGGQKANKPRENMNGHLRPTPSTRRVKSNPAMRSKISSKPLSMDEEMISQRVRSMYNYGLEEGSDWDQRSGLSQQKDTITEEDLLDREDDSAVSVSRATSASDLRSSNSTIGHTPGRRRASFIEREENEIAGGVEDWKDVQNEDVDRYGFIVPRSPTSKDPTQDGLARTPSSLDPQSLQRVSTTLQLASEAPRRKRTIRRAPSDARNATKSPALDRNPSTKSARPSSGQSSYAGSITGSQSRLRIAANRLPHNKARRTMDEAGDMLTLRPSSTNGLQGGACSEREDGYARRKEMEREDKWRKMAKIVSKKTDGGGMVFEFDTRSNKVIERTWKGIPDSWRATAWHAFLSASARKNKDSLSDEQLIEAFHEYQSEGSPDDYQIDLDVPRTINSHIMFRRRYRGGQRLLFRVLHAMSLHFPGTGYVQGMAALAVTLLAYYDEEKAFIMLVRLWQLRGLDRLYKGGLSGLMEALEDFKDQWLEGGEVAEKLVSRLTLQNFGVLIDGRLGHAGHRSYCVRHPMVLDVVQLLNTIPSATTGLGCVHAPW